MGHRLGEVAPQAEVGRPLSLWGDTTTAVGVVPMRCHLVEAVLLLAEEGWVTSLWDQATPCPQLLYGHKRKVGSCSRTSSCQVPVCYTQVQPLVKAVFSVRHCCIPPLGPDPGLVTHPYKPLSDVNKR